MSKKEAIGRYQLIIKLLRKRTCSFTEIHDYLLFESELQDYDFTVSKRTFRRDLDDILSIFNIDIQYDYSSRKYFIEDDDFSFVTSRMMEAYDVYSILNAPERFSNYIHLDRRTTKGSEHLHLLLQAITKNCKVEYTYQKYWDRGDSKSKVVAPYGIKEFKQRWYLIGRDESDKKIKTFALERIEDLDILIDQNFDYPKSFNIAEYFKDCFGIVTPNAQKTEEVSLWFAPKQANYIKSFPFHTSQQIVQEDENGMIIKLTLFITYDFIMELLSLGQDVKVLAPLSLINEIKEIYMNAINQYELGETKKNEC